MSTRPPWEIDDSPPWEVEDTNRGVRPPRQRPRTPAPAPSLWERTQQASSRFVSGIPDFLRGAAEETPLVAARLGNLGEQIGQGALLTAADAAGVDEMESPTLRRIQEVRNQRQQALDESSLQPEEDAGLAESLGRGVARAAPQVALGVATGGASLPVQIGAAALGQGAQALSEGASPGEAAGQAALAAGGQGVGAAVGWAARPFARAISQRTVDAARRLGITLPASAVTDSSAAQIIEGAAAKGAGGGRIGRRTQQAIESLSDTGEGIAAAGNAEAAGQGLASDYRAAREGLRAGKNAAYGRVGNLTQIDAVPQQTLDEIDAMLQEGTAAPDVLARLRQLRAAVAPERQVSFRIGGRPVSPDMEVALRQTMEQDPNMLQAVGAEVVERQQPRSAANIISQQAGIDYGGPNALGDEALANRLRGSLGSDVDAALAAQAPEQLAARNAAKDAYREYAQLSGSPFGRRISTLAEQGQWDKVASIVRSTESTQNIRKMVDLMSPETMGEVRSNVMADIVSRSMRGGNFTPQSLERALRQWSPEKLRMVLAPEQVQRLQDLSEVARALGKTTRITGGSQSAYLARQMAAPALALNNPLGLMRMLIGDAGMSAFVGSNAGQRWLTSGIMPNAGRNVTAAGRLGASLAGGPIRDYAREVELARRARQTAR